MLLETANERAVDSSILIISLVQSATTYLRNSLSEVLDIPVYRRLTGGTWNTEEILYPIALEDIRSNPVVAYTHAHPNSQNFIMLNAALDRAILNIRDPRQVLVSIVHFIDAHVIPKPVYFAAHRFPTSYEQQSFEWKLAYHLENTYPQFIAWIQGWLDAMAGDELATDLLLIQHQELKENRVDYFNRIYDFFGIDSNRIAMPDDNPKPGENYYRKADREEWRRMLSSSQINQVNGLMPSEFWERFRWNP
ncbi:MAG: sulfotransferase domain-containing protein [Pseudomonadales bacterium]|nr:sulfotransferase domain-containing protein [Pseudomonadales bacterium]